MRTGLGESGRKLHETSQEMKRVSWPTLAELKQTNGEELVTVTVVSGEVASPSVARYLKVSVPKKSSSGV